jgi:hypothetical protein
MEMEEAIESDARSRLPANREQGQNDCNKRFEQGGIER